MPARFEKAEWESPMDSATPESTRPMLTFPGGEAAPGYRWAFRVFSVTFLFTLCAGLANFVLPKIGRMFG
jgi:hypothetical protein